MISLKKHRILPALLAVEAALFFAHPQVATRAWHHTFDFALSILGILPPVLLLIGLLEAWIPATLVGDYLGEKSGAKGMFFAALMGSLAAGPLFTAFPVAASMTQKGGRLANTVIFLGAWATIKVPLLLMESRFLGLKFSLLRLAVTLPFIVLIGVLVEVLSANNKRDSEFLPPAVEIKK
jgi:uncharacterized membrane protein YraQ (UPF0718 family)